MEMASREQEFNMKIIEMFRNGVRIPEILAELQVTITIVRRVLHQSGDMSFR